MHLHFGPGAIGLGLVLPLFVDQRRLVIVCRASSAFGAQVKARVIHTVWVKVVSEEGASVQTRQFQAVFADDPATHGALSAQAGESVLFFCDDVSLFNDVVKDAVSVSIAVRTTSAQEAVAASLARVTWSAGVPPIFVFENEWAVKGHTLPISELVIDRICLPPSVDQNLSLIVRVEDYRFVVARRPLEWSPDDWYTVRSDGEFAYYWRRKRYLVNAVHAVLMFVSFAYLLERKLGVGEWRDQFLPVLVDAMRGTGHWHLYKTFVETQAMRVVLETPAVDRAIVFPGATEEEIYRHLLRYSREVLARMTALPDSVDRIFGVDKNEPNVLRAAERKFGQHINPYIEFVATHANQIEQFKALGPPASHEGMQAGLQLQEMAKKVAYHGFALK